MTYPKPHCKLIIINKVKKSFPIYIFGFLGDTCCVDFDPPPTQYLTYVPSSNSVDLSNMNIDFFIEIFMLCD